MRLLFVYRAVCFALILGVAVSFFYAHSLSEELQSLEREIKIKKVKRANDLEKKLDKMILEMENEKRMDKR